MRFPVFLIRCRCCWILKNSYFFVLFALEIHFLPLPSVSLNFFFLSQIQLVKVLSFLESILTITHCYSQYLLHWRCHNQLTHTKKKQQNKNISLWFAVLNISSPGFSFYFSETWQQNYNWFLIFKVSFNLILFFCLVHQSYVNQFGCS